MSLLQRLRGRFGGAEQQLSGAIRIGGQSYNASWSFHRVLDSVYRNPTGRRCIERNAYAFMRPMWQIHEDGKDRKPIEDHAFADVLNRPLPNSTGTKMQYFLRRDLDISGGSFWLKMRGADLYGDKGPVTGLKRLPAQQVAVLTSDDDDLLGFIYTDRAGRRAPILPDEMVYVNLPDPEREWDRCPPGLTAGLPADISNSAMRFNAELLANDGGLPGYLVVEGLTTKQFNEWVTAWRSQEATGKTRMLSSSGANGKGGANYVRVGVSNQELMYDRLKAMADDDICRALGYPAVLLNPDGTTFANMDIAQRTWIAGEVFPLWVWTSDFFTVALRDEIGEGKRIGFDLSDIEELTENLDAVVARGIQLVAARAMTINELRDELGLPPVAWGNDFPDPPAADVLANDAKPGDGKPAGDKPGDPGASDPKPTKALVVTTKAPSKFLPAFHAAVERREKAALPVLETFFLDQGDAIARRIEGKKGKAYAKAVEPTAWWDGVKWNTSLAQVVHDELSTTTKDIGDLAMVTFQPGADYDATSPRMEQYLDERSVTIAALVNNTTEADVRELIGGMAAAGESIDDIAKAVRSFFVDNAATRAMRVARTELIGAANFASLDAAHQTDLITGKTWNPAGDADAQCKALEDLGTIPLDATFNGIEHPPAHINCRCALDYEVD